MAPPKRTDEELAKAAEIGARIRRLRLAQKLTLQQLAVRANMHGDHLRELEHGRHVAYRHTLDRIATALGTTGHYLRTGRKNGGGK